MWPLGQTILKKDTNYIGKSFENSWGYWLTTPTFSRLPNANVMPQGLSYVPCVYLYLYSAIYVSRLAYVYHRTALPLIPDISAISILSCFRFTDTSWLTCLFGPHFSRSRCPFDSYLPLLFLTRVSHFYSYDFDLFCSLLSTILRISQPIPGSLTRLLGSL